MKCLIDGVLDKFLISYFFFLSKKVLNLVLQSPLIGPEVGRGPRSITKIGLHTHPPPPPQTFLHEGEALGVPKSVCDLY